MASETVMDLAVTVEQLRLRLADAEAERDRLKRENRMLRSVAGILAGPPAATEASDG